MPKYPEAGDLTPDESRRNQAQFRWFIQECARRNIRVLLHFYNIHISEPCCGPRLAAQSARADAAA